MASNVASHLNISHHNCCCLFKARRNSPSNTTSSHSLASSNRTNYKFRSSIKYGIPGADWTSSRLPSTTHSRSVLTRMSPLDQAWGTSMGLDTLNQVLPQNLFAISIIPYAGFLYHLTKSKQAPPLTLFGFYFLLVFVFATIPAGIYAKKVYGTSLANVDYLHGAAEFLLTITNLFIVLGLRQGIRDARNKKEGVVIESENAIDTANNE